MNNQAIPSSGKHFYNGDTIRVGQESQESYLFVFKTYENLSPEPEVRMSEETAALFAAIRENVECPVCLALLSRPVAGHCNHILCRECMLNCPTEIVNGRSQIVCYKCPLCRALVDKKAVKPCTNIQNICETMQKYVSEKDRIDRFIARLRAGERDRNVRQCRA